MIWISFHKMLIAYHKNSTCFRVMLIILVVALLRYYVILEVAKFALRYKTTRQYIHLQIIPQCCSSQMPLQWRIQSATTRTQCGHCAGTMREDKPSAKAM